MLPRILAKVVISSGEVFVRAFAEAFKQAGRQGFGSTVASSKMRIQEARAILDVPEDASKELVEKKFQHLFKANDPAQGGSFYLQSKVYRAKEAVEAGGSSSPFSSGGEGGTGVAA